MPKLPPRTTNTSSVVAGDNKGANESSKPLLPSRPSEMPPPSASSPSTRVESAPHSTNAQGNGTAKPQLPQRTDAGGSSISYPHPSSSASAGPSQPTALPKLPSRAPAMSVSSPNTTSSSLSTPQPALPPRSTSPALPARQTEESPRLAPRPTGESHQASDHSQLRPGSQPPLPNRRTQSYAPPVASTALPLPASQPSSNQAPISPRSSSTGNGMAPMSNAPAASPRSMSTQHTSAAPPVALPPRNVNTSNVSHPPSLHPVNEAKPSLPQHSSVQPTLPQRAPIEPARGHSQSVSGAYPNRGMPPPSFANGGPPTLPSHAKQSTSPAPVLPPHNPSPPLPAHNAYPPQQSAPPMLPTHNQPMPGPPQNFGHPPPHSGPSPQYGMPSLNQAPYNNHPPPQQFGMPPPQHAAPPQQMPPPQYGMGPPQMHHPTPQQHGMPPIQHQQAPPPHLPPSNAHTQAPPPNLPPSNSPSLPARSSMAPGMLPQIPPRVPSPNVSSSPAATGPPKLDRTTQPVPKADKAARSHAIAQVESTSGSTGLYLGAEPGRMPSEPQMSTPKAVPVRAPVVPLREPSPPPPVRPTSSDPPANSPLLYASSTPPPSNQSSAPSSAPPKFQVLPPSSGSAPQLPAANAKRGPPPKLPPSASNTASLAPNPKLMITPSSPQTRARARSFDASGPPPMPDRQSQPPAFNRQTMAIPSSSSSSPSTPAPDSSSSRDKSPNKKDKSPGRKDKSPGKKDGLAVDDQPKRQGRNRSNSADGFAHTVRDLTSDHVADGKYSIQVQTPQKQAKVLGEKDYIMMYPIEVRKGAQTWTIFRRYNQFYKMDSELRRHGFFKKSGIKSEIPAKNSSVSKKDPLFLEGRRRGFQTYLESLCTHELLYNSDHFYVFIQPLQMGDTKPVDH